MKLPLSIAAIIARKFSAVKSFPEKHPASIDITLKNAPPPPKPEPMPSPRAGLVWIPGFWNYVGGWYAWHAGNWELARDGQHYVRAEWKQCVDGWQLHRGRWQDLPGKSYLDHADDEPNANTTYDPLAAYR